MPLGYDSMDSACASSCKSAAISTRQAMFLDAFASHAQSGPPSIETHESNRSESSIRVVTPGHQRFSGAESSSRTPSRGFVPTPPIQVNRNRSRINHSHTTSAEVSSESARKSKRKHEDSASDHTPVQNFIRPRKKTCKLFLPTTTAPAAAAAAAAALTNTAPTSGASSLPIARDVSSDESVTDVRRAREAIAKTYDTAAQDAKRREKDAFNFYMAAVSCLQPDADVVSKEKEEARRRKIEAESARVRLKTYSRVADAHDEVASLLRFKRAGHSTNPFAEKVAERSRNREEIAAQSCLAAEGIAENAQEKSEMGVQAERHNFALCVRAYNDHCRAKEVHRHFRAQARRAREFAAKPSFSAELDAGGGVHGAGEERSESEGPTISRKFAGARKRSREEVVDLGDRLPAAKKRMQIEGVGGGREHLVVTAYTETETSKSEAEDHNGDSNDHNASTGEAKAKESTVDDGGDGLPAGAKTRLEGGNSGGERLVAVVDTGSETNESEAESHHHDENGTNANGGGEKGSAGYLSRLYKSAAVVAEKVQQGVKRGANSMWKYP